MKYLRKPEKDRILNILLEQAMERGFLEGDTITNEDGSRSYRKGSKAITTYKCAKSGKDCTFYFYPREFIYNSNHRGALTDGKGGYIYYEGKWAENTTKSWVTMTTREEKIKSLGL